MNTFFWAIFTHNNPRWSHYTKLKLHVKITHFQYFWDPPKFHKSRFQGSPCLIKGSRAPPSSPVVRTLAGMILRSHWLVWLSIEKDRVGHLFPALWAVNVLTGVFPLHCEKWITKTCVERIRLTGWRQRLSLLAASYCQARLQLHQQWRK